MHHAHTHAQTQAAEDAVHEARTYGPVDFAQALSFVPDEFHAKHGSPEERFVASVVANANAAGRSAYTVASFALDF